MTAQPQKKSTAATLLGALILAGAVGFIGWGVWRATLPQPVPVQGMVDATTISVSAKIPGRIESVLVKEGDRIEAGTPVAKIAIPELEAKLAQVEAVARAAGAKASLADEGARSEEIRAAKAQKARADAALALAQRSWERVDALFKEGLVSAQRHDEVRTQRDGAREAVRAAAAQVEALETGLRAQEKDAAHALLAQAEGGVSEVRSMAEEAFVKTPLSGEVSKIIIDPGEIAPAGFPLVQVTDLTDVWMSFNLREDDLPGVAPGTRWQVEVPALGKTVEVEVYWVSARGDYAVWRATRQNSGYDLRTFEVRARPVTPVEGLRPGMSAILPKGL